MYIEVIKTSKITIFQPTYSSSGSLVARAPPDSSGCRWDRTPLQMCGVTHTHPHSGTFQKGQFISCAQLLKVGGNQSRGETPPRRGGDVQSPHKQRPVPSVHFFPRIGGMTKPHPRTGHCGRTCTCKAVSHSFKGNPEESREAMGIF